MTAVWAGLFLFALFSAGDVRADVVIKISKSQQQIGVSVDGAQRYRWSTSTGRRGYGTPNGAYRPQRLERSWYSRKYGNAPMPHSIFFHRGYAIHGTTEVARLGRPASHGCVRLAPANAATLFSLVQRQGMNRTRIIVSDAALSHAKPSPAERPVRRAPVQDDFSDSIMW
ncbi:MAG: L,D-transpeptidase [Pseudorhodoplanes sp.]